MIDHALPGLDVPALAWRAALPAGGVAVGAVALVVAPGPLRAVADALGARSTPSRGEAWPSPPPCSSCWPSAAMTRCRGWSPAAQRLHLRRASSAPDERVWRKLHDGLAALVAYSRHLIARRSGHNIQDDQPQLVLKVIGDVVEAVRHPASWTTH